MLYTGYITYYLSVSCYLIPLSYLQSEVMLDTLIKLNSSRAGHDKLIRTVQYTCKLIAASSRRHSAKYDNLASMIGATRKFLRLGTCVDALYSSFTSVSHPDPFVRLTVTLSRIANTMYLFCDHLIFLHNNNIISIDSKVWDNLSDRCWLYSIIMDLVKNIYLVNNVVTKLGSVSSSFTFLYFFANHKNLVTDTIKNFADVVLPLTSLGKNNVNKNSMRNEFSVQVTLRRHLNSWPSVELFPL